MAETTEEMPLIVIQPDKMSWKSTIKVCAVLALCCVLSAYLYIYIRVLILKNQRLEHIAVMIMNAEKMIENLYVADQNVALDLEELNDTFLDY